jgi:glycosyltransferase involved in cell wall biosynthesis
MAELADGWPCHQEPMTERDQLRVLIAAWNYPLPSETYIETERRFLGSRALTHVVAHGGAGPEATPEHGSFLAAPSRRQLRRMLGEYAPDVVHVHWGMTAEWAVQIARRTGVPWTLRTHSFDVLVRPDDEIRRVAALANDNDCLGVLGFPFARAILEQAGLKPEKFVETFPVADVARFRSAGPNGEAVLSFGALQERKALAAAAFARLSAMVPDVEFHHYPMGHGTRDELRAQMQAIVDREGGRIEIRDWVPHGQMPAVCDEHRWFVYPGPAHQGFGWPVGVIEAWAAGVGVCIQRIRPDIEHYVGDAAVLFDDVKELPSLLEAPPDPGMLARARDRAETMDIGLHGHRLLEAWRLGGLPA